MSITDRWPSSTSYLEYANPDCDAGGRAQTVSLWLNLDASANFHTGWLFQARNGADPLLPAIAALRHDSPRSLSFQVYVDPNNQNATVGRQTVSNALPADSWHHVAMTWDGDLDPSGVHIYVDGVEATYDHDNQSAGTPISGDGPWRVAANLNGRIAEVGWWNRVLTAGEMAALAAGYSPRFFLRGLKFAPDLRRETIDPISGRSASMYQVTVADHPPVLYPASARMSSPAPPAAVPSSSPSPSPSPSAASEQSGVSSPAPSPSPSSSSPAASATADRLDEDVYYRIDE
jgi:hypothetical protein